MITAQDVKKLRDQTGAGMMDCKKALTETNGDFEKAIEALRKKGQKVSAARADRATTEGMVFTKTSSEHNYGVIIALGCETDFVAKNESFQQLGQSISDIAFTERPATIEDLLQLKLEGRDSIEEKITDLTGKVGEKVTIRTYKALSSETVVPYTHLGNKLGVLVGLEGGSNAQMIEVGKVVAMQITAMNPLALDKDDLDGSVIEKELAIAREQARNEDKPEAMIDKVAQGRLNKFFQEHTLLNQIFIKDNKLTVAQYLQGVNPGLRVSAFARVSVVD